MKSIQPNRRRFLSLAALGVAGLPLVTSGQVSAIETFDEVYQGRRIQGAVFAGAERHLPPQSVLIDGRSLHVMRNADGCFISAVDHYRPVRALRELACKAVEVLDGAQLVPAHHGGR